MRRIFGVRLASSMSLRILSIDTAEVACPSTAEVVLISRVGGFERRGAPSVDVRLSVAHYRRSESEILSGPRLLVRLTVSRGRSI
jgi:hypothetical protein